MGLKILEDFVEIDGRFKGLKAIGSGFERGSSGTMSWVWDISFQSLHFGLD